MFADFPSTQKERKNRGGKEKIFRTNIIKEKKFF
jgi:hypothetical protein